jgi:hypothetical protein
VFALRSNPTWGEVLTMHSGLGTTLPLFFDPQWATDFAQRHSLPFLPSEPLSPKLLHKLLTTGDDRPSNVIFDPIAAEVTHETRVFNCDDLIERLEEMRDGE